jgi:hypothetical protein
MESTVLGNRPERDPVEAGNAWHAVLVHAGESSEPPVHGTRCPGTWTCEKVFSWEKYSACHHRCAAAAGPT